MTGTGGPLSLERESPSDTLGATIEVHHVAAGVGAQIDRAPREAAVITQTMTRSR